MPQAVEYFEAPPASTPTTSGEMDLHAESSLATLRPPLVVDYVQLAVCLPSKGALYRGLKRAMDICGALVGCVVFGPIMLIGMLLVWIEDGGPVIFRQKRVGLNGETFTIFKIRSMVVDAEDRFCEVESLNKHDDSRTFKLHEDPRVLQVGSFLRRFSIDEFPQLFNVLRGEMSLVGPRPPLVREVSQYAVGDHVKFLVKPGLTCFWQISGRGDIAFEGQIELDQRYVEEQSLSTDIGIIAKTLPAMIRGHGAH